LSSQIILDSPFTTTLKPLKQFFTNTESPFELTSSLPIISSTFVANGDTLMEFISFFFLVVASSALAIPADALCVAILRAVFRP
jgi:hypothetical protein